MCLGEAVFGKLGHQIKDLLNLLWRIAALHRALDKAFTLLGHLFGFLLSHGAPQQIGFAQRVAGQPVGNLHHVLLVNDHAERFFQDLLQFRQFVLDLLAAMLAIDEVVDHAALNGAGTVEGVQGGEVFDGVGLVAAQHVAHAAGFKLEDAGGQRAVEHFFVSFMIIEREGCEINLLAAGLRDQFHRVIQNGERRQAQEIHLQQAHLLDGDHVEGGDDFVVLGAMQRNQLGQRARRDHDTRGVHARVAHQAFQLARGVEQLAHLRFAVVGLLQAGRFPDRVLQLDVQRGGDHLGDPVHVGVRDIHRAPHVFDRRLGRHGAEGDDLRHIFAAVFLGHVIDDFAAPVHAEIHVDIGQRNALGIQEALEEQLVLQGIDIGDPQRIGNQRARGRSAARSHRNAMLARVADKIPDNQEVSGKLHLLDDGDFLRQTLLVFGDAMLQPRLGSRRCAASPAAARILHE